MPKVAILSLTTILLVGFFSFAIASEGNSGGVAAESSIFQDVRLVAALVAAIVTVLVNIIAKPLIDRALETWKSNLSIRKARIEADLNYELEAKKRLHTAVGPLRFQLLLAARDAVSRIKSLGNPDRDFPITVNNYYGISTLYRIIRPLALSELIEEQITYADFSVDEDAIELLKFKRASYAAFSSGLTVLGHPDANWNDEEQHIFYDSITRLANSIILNGSDSVRRVMTFPEFEEFVSTKEHAKRIEPLPSIFKDFGVKQKSQFWARLVLFGYICSKFVNKHGVPIGFGQINHPVNDLLKRADDQYISERLPEFGAQFDQTASMGV